MECRACESQNSGGATYCYRCSAPLPPSCPACGTPLKHHGELCASCRTEQVPSIDPDQLFVDADDRDVTQITTLPYELRPKYSGRRDAIEALMDAYEEARDDSGIAFALLIGEPGMGKTRTVKEFGKRLKKSDQDVRFLQGDGGAGGELSAFARILGARFGVTAGEAPDTSQEKIIAGVAEVLPASRVTEVAHLLAHLMRIPFGDSPVVTPLVSTPRQLEMRTFIAIRRFLAADADAGPLVLVLENLELCGEDTINLLHYLAAGLASVPVVIVGTARKQLFKRFPSFGDSDIQMLRIDLGPLSEAESEELLRELCRPLDTIPELLVEHARKLAGSPRALFELIRLLLESDVIVRSGSMSWRINEEALGELDLPESYDALVAARLEVMDDAERDLIEKAAVIGETFWLDAVVALVRLGAHEGEDPDGPTLSQIAAAGDHTRVSVAQTLAKLVEREWLCAVTESSVPGEREYRFTYPNLWTVLYSEIDEDNRRDYHRMVAQWLELRPEGRGPLAQEDVGRHLELAGEANAAAQRYRRAADAARSQYFNDRAIRLYAQGLSCLGVADHASRIHLWHDLGSVYELKGDFEAALGAFERMLRLAWLVASRTKAAVAFNKMGRVWRGKGDLKLALEYLKRGQELFEQAGDQRGIAGSYDDIGKTLYLLGLYDEAFEKVTKALSARGRGGDQRSIAHSLSNLGNIQQDRGQLMEAENCHIEALELRRAAGDRPGVVSSLNNLAVIAYDRGDFETASRGWKQALQEAEEISALPLQALALANLGELALNEGRHEEARSRIEDALDIAEDIDDKRLQVEATRNLALLENNVGNRTRARSLAAHAHEIASSAGLRDNEGRALLTLGEVHGGTLFDASTPDDEDSAEMPDAEGFFRRGVDVLREIGNDAELARGLEQYGRYKIEQGEIDEGKDLLREALVIFSKLGMGRGTEVERVLASV